VYEYGDVGMRVFGDYGRVGYSLAIVVYLIGVITTKCILTANTLSKVFSSVSVLC
jgi:amino acid permease